MGFIHRVILGSVALTVIFPLLFNGGSTVFRDTKEVRSDPFINFETNAGPDRSVFGHETNVPGLSSTNPRQFWNDTTVTNASMEGLPLDHEKATGDWESSKTAFFKAKAASAVSLEKDEAANEKKRNLRGHRALANGKSYGKKTSRDNCLEAVSNHCEFDTKKWECCLNDSGDTKCNAEVKDKCDLCWSEIQEQCLMGLPQVHQAINTKLTTIDIGIKKILEAIEDSWAAFLAKVGHVSSIVTVFGGAVAIWKFCCQLSLCMLCGRDNAIPPNANPIATAAAAARVGNW